MWGRCHTSVRDVYGSTPSIITVLRNDVNNFYINTFRIAIIIAHLSSLLTRTLSVGDRFLAVKFSLEYNSKITKIRLMIVLFMIWLLSITIAILPWVNVATLVDYHKRKKVTNNFKNCNVSSVTRNLEVYKWCKKKTRKGNKETRKLLRCWKRKPG